MARRVPAHAGFFTVTLVVPGTFEWCRESQQAFTEWMHGLGEDEEHRPGLLAMPAVEVAEHEDGESGELVLRWVEEPAESAWAAIEGIVEGVAKAVFPDLLRTATAVSVTATAERVVGRDVAIPG